MQQNSFLITPTHDELKAREAKQVSNIAKIVREAYQAVSQASRDRSKTLTVPYMTLPGPVLVGKDMPAIEMDTNMDPNGVLATMAAALRDTTNALPYQTFFDSVMEHLWAEEIDVTSHQVKTFTGWRPGETPRPSRIVTPRFTIDLMELDALRLALLLSQPLDVAVELKAQLSKRQGTAYQIRPFRAYWRLEAFLLECFGAVELWFPPTKPMSFRAHLPGFVDTDRKPEAVEVGTQAELLALPDVKKFADLSGFSGFALSHYHDESTESLLMALVNQGKEHWVVGYIKNPQGLDLPKWKAPARTKST